MSVPRASPVARRRRLKGMNEETKRGQNRELFWLSDICSSNITSYQKMAVMIGGKNIEKDRTKQSIIQRSDVFSCGTCSELYLRFRLRFGFKLILRFRLGVGLRMSFRLIGGESFDLD